MDPLMLDLYPGDVGGKIPDWSLIVKESPPWNAVVLKATEGDRCYDPEWFRTSWQLLGDAITYDPRGADLHFYAGAYHYLRVHDPVPAQTEAYLTALRDAGGFLPGDLPPIVDVESSNNTGVTAQQVIDSVSAWSLAVLAETGKRPILYGHELMYSLGIKSHMECQALWIALYGPTLPARNERFGGYEDIGWDLADVFAWQYCGDGESYLEGYPKTSPIVKKPDISAIIINGGGTGALNWLSENCFV